MRAEVRHCGGAGEVAGEEVGIGGRVPGRLRDMARIIKDGSEAERRARRAAPMPRDEPVIMAKRGFIASCWVRSRGKE